MSEELKPLPGPVLRDHVRIGIDAGIAAVPLVGGPIQVLVDAVLVPSITKRREAWFEKLGELLNGLSERVDGWDPSRLAGDEIFVTAVGEASRIAMGTHLEAKLDILKNCLARLVLEEGRDEFLDLQLFGFVDVLEPEHFLVLQYLSSPGAWFDARGISRPQIGMGSPRSVMVHGELPVSGPSLEIVLRELDARGLADTGSLGTLMSGEGAWQRRTTDLGEELLGFVRDV